ncbi:MAG: outer membrane protein assembly factor BamD [Rhodobacteraceae bacterium]|nr:outer membrane protein assembly factor BamD [Paracoccaceae bacterium]
MDYRVWIKRAGMLALVVTVSACAREGRQVSVDDTTSPQEILALAEAEVQRNKLDRAGDLFLEVERLYPYTVEAEYAIIQAAKSYQGGKKRLESRAAAQRYVDFFPAGQYAALAHYLIALSYYDQIVDVQRDQENTFKALQALRIVVERFPNSEYAALAAPKFTTALNQLAGKEMDVGRYYLKKGQFAAAIGRFDVVVREYGDTPHRPEAYLRLVEAYLSFGLNGQAAQAAGLLAAQYPDNQWTRAASSLLGSGR